VEGPGFTLPRPVPVAVPVAGAPILARVVAEGRACSSTPPQA
jgi:hypothetical protein